MESSKIKNILIAILLFVNLGLLGLIWNDHQQSRENTRQAMESLERVFANRGISMEQVDLPENSALMTYGMSRDLDREQKLVEQVLGTVTVEDQGGNIMYYYGEKGQASFRGTGDFEILFSDGAVTGEEDPAATAKKMLPQKYNDQKFLHKSTIIRHFSKRLFYLPYPHTANIKQWNVSAIHRIFKYEAFDDILFEYIYLKKKFEQDTKR